MRGWRNRLLLVFILVLAVSSVVTVWPSEPDRYLPSFIPWPEGKGAKFPWIKVNGGAITFQLKTARAMKLGLDLQGGTRLVLEADTSQAPDVDVNAALTSAAKIIENRVNKFGVAESEIQRQGSDRLAVSLPGIDPAKARDLVGRTAVLEFREPKFDANQSIMTCQGGTVTYNPPGCDGGQEVAVSPTSLTQATEESVIWVPATAVGSDGLEKDLTGRFLKNNTFVSANNVGLPILNFEMTSQGAPLLEQVTNRLIDLPMAFFLDGEPVRGTDNHILAPTVRAVISDKGIIEGLSVDDARLLSIQLNGGALPVPLKVIQQVEVDATLGEDSVQQSVIAGEVALLIVMLFMTLFYRLPGALASLALIRLHQHGAGHLQGLARHLDAGRHCRFRALRGYGGGRQHPDLRAYKRGVTRGAQLGRCD